MRLFIATLLLFFAPQLYSQAVGGFIGIPWGSDFDKVKEVLLTRNDVSFKGFRTGERGVEIYTFSGGEFATLPVKTWTIQISPDFGFFLANVSLDVPESEIPKRTTWLKQGLERRYGKEYTMLKSDSKIDYIWTHKRDDEVVEVINLTRFIYEYVFSYLHVKYMNQELQQKIFSTREATIPADL